MIVAKPKNSTIFSILTFSIPVLAVGVYGLIEITGSSQWYHYALAIVCIPIALGLIARQILGYKTLSFGKQKLTIRYKFRSKSITHNLKDLKAWRENLVKTPSGTFKEINLLFENNQRIDFSMQEYSNYDKVETYLRKNCGRKYREE